MDVLIVSQYFWPEQFRVNDAAADLVRRGHNVTVLTGQPNYPQGRLYPGYDWRGPWTDTFEGVRVLRVPLITRGPSRGLRLAANYASFALTASALGPILARGPFDVVLVWETSPATVGLPGALLSYLSDAPMLFWVLDLWPETLEAIGATRSPLVLSAFGQLSRFIYERSELVLTSSRGFSSSILRWGGREEQIRWFPNWAEDLAPTPHREPAPRAPALPNGFRVLFAGNIGAAQDFPTILAAAELLRELPDLRWCIAGDGREADWVRSEIASRGLQDQVHLLGRFPLEVMPALYEQADALLVTLRREPIFAMTVPGKIQTYMAAGKPIIAALEGEGAALVTESGAGLACPAQDPAALAAAVSSMYTSPSERRAEMAASAKAYCDKHFRRDELLGRLEEWMMEAVAAHRERPRRTKP